jgi:hypothetical protein
MIKPVRCVLIEIEPRKVVIRRMIGRVALWMLVAAHIVGFYFISALHVSWVLADMKESAQREKLIKQSAYVAEGSYKGFGYRKEK